MLNVICVNKDNYLGRGEEYVDRLREGVARNLSGDFRFRILTDGRGDGWWSKIDLFEPGRFKGRCLYFDLDTLIVGSLDHLAAYRGDFAMLTDFFHPHLKASGVMAWEAGAADHVFTKWQEAGFPSFHPRGDGGWIEAMMPNAERLQELFPSQIVSFKADCIAHGIPPGARVVCFHGLPRPHTLSDLMAHW